MTSIFDPLSYENLGASISRALDDQPLVRLDEVSSFDGVGIYALYYVGGFPAYRLLSEANQQTPGSWAIYVGKAEAENARKGDPNQASSLDGPKLYNRIMQHKRSIQSAQNLDSSHFMVRFLTIAPTWVSLAEVIAIRMHKPLWNSIIDGLGNHMTREREEGRECVQDGILSILAEHGQILCNLVLKQRMILCKMRFRTWKDANGKFVHLNSLAIMLSCLENVQFHFS